ncbi:hypothetical protein ACRAWB_03785 [Leifsonia poae]|uniref:hypothetical protein n=1 Tax=Leifsonia poae TaxID=110933 RepID=UPI003D6821BD
MTDGDEFRVRYSTKESVEYLEGVDAFEFRLGSFVDIPRAEDWDRVVPEAFRGRRDEIVARLMSDRLLVGTPARDVFA